MRQQMEEGSHGSWSAPSRSPVALRSGSCSPTPSVHRKDLMNPTMLNQDLTIIIWL